MKVLKTLITNSVLLIATASYLNAADITIEALRSSEQFKEGFKAEQDFKIPVAVQKYQFTYKGKDNVALVSLHRIVDLMVESGKVEEAVVNLETYLQHVDPLEVSARKRVVELTLANGSIELARQHFKVLEQLRTKDPITFTLAARIALAENKFEEALSVLAKTELAVLVAPDTAVEVAYLKCTALTNLSRSDECISFGEDIEKVLPTDGWIKLALGQAYIQKGIKHLAVKRLNDAADKGNLHPDLSLGVARAFMSINENASARDVLANAVEKWADNFEMKLTLAQAYDRLQRFDLSVKTLVGMQKQWPHYDIVAYRLAEAYIKSGEVDAAGRSLKSFVEKYQDRAWASVAYARLMVKMDRKDVAIASIYKSLETAPMRHESVLLLAELVADEGRYKDAIRILQQAAKKYNTNLNAQLDIAQSYYKLGLNTEAEDLITVVQKSSNEVALSKRVESIRARFKESRAIASLKDENSKIDDLQKIILKKP